MVDLDENGLSPEEIAAIEVLRANGWRITESPYVEDTFGSDPGFEEGRHRLAVCKE